MWIWLLVAVLLGILGTNVARVCRKRESKSKSVWWQVCFEHAWLLAIFAWLAVTVMVVFGSFSVATRRR